MNVAQTLCHNIINKSESTLKHYMRTNIAKCHKINYKHRVRRRYTGIHFHNISSTYIHQSLKELKLLGIK